MGITLEGIEGEQKLFTFLRNKSVDFFQADAIGLNKDKYELYEVKHQDRYLSPPFDGHGLPKWQIKARLSFQEKTGIRCVLIVFEKDTNNIYYNYMDNLEKKAFFDTKGTKPRRIYKLDSFIEA